MEPPKVGTQEKSGSWGDYDSDDDDVIEQADNLLERNRQEMLERLPREAAELKASTSTMMKKKIRGTDATDAGQKRRYGLQRSSRRSIRKRHYDRRQEGKNRGESLTRNDT